MHLKTLCHVKTLLDPFVRLERRIRQALVSPDPLFFYPFTESADALDPAYYLLAGFCTDCSIVVLSSRRR